jgi:hypothetical protein
MPTYYIDLDNGSDAGTGADWANAWKTITNGATAARIAPGDEIRISKTPDPASIGNAKWESTTEAAGGFPAARNITAMADNGSGLIRITAANHGCVTGDIAQIVALVTTGTTYESNGDYVVTYVDANNVDLDGSVYVNSRASGGTIQKINSKCVYLASAQTKTVTTCDKVWTGANSGTAAIVLATTDAKKGGSCMRITAPSSAATNTLYGYFAITSTDFSGYQKLTFWVKNSAAVLATHWKVCLCSDTAGATVVDTFELPAIPSTTRWLPLTLTKTGGGNLGAAIQSIALYSNSVAPTNSSNLLLDNFEACTTSGLNMQSLISKNSAAYGGDEAWYGIQSIHGRIVLFDSETNKRSYQGRGYWSTTAVETVPTYIRETFKTAIASASTTVVSDVTDNGTFSNLITYSGGWNTSTNLQDGDTYLDGINGNGYGVVINNKTYIYITRCNTVRYYTGIYLQSSYNISIANNNIVNNTLSGFYYNSSYNNDNDITNVNNNGNYGIYIQNSCNNNNTVVNANNNDNYGIYIQGSGNNDNIVSNANNNNTYALNYNTSSNNSVYNMTSIVNRVSSVNTDSNINLLRNCTLNETTEISGWLNGSKGKIRSINHDGTTDNNWVFANYATANWQTTTVHDTEPGSWKCIISNAQRNEGYKFDLEAAQIACKANKLVTVKAWIKKDHATDIACELRVEADTVRGIAADAATAATDTTDWQEVTLTFTPTKQCVVPVIFNTWYVADNSNTYLGSVTITQAT